MSLKLLGLFLSCRMILDISVALQKFPNKDPDCLTITFVPALSSTERKVTLCLLFFLRQLKTKQQEGKFRFLHRRSCRGSAVTNAWAGSAAALHVEPESSLSVQT